MSTDGSSGPPSEWLADYELDAPLNAQTHCVTLRARRLRDGRAVTIRALKGHGPRSAAARDALDKERKTLAAVDHPAVPTLLEVVDDGERLALVISDHGGHRLDAVAGRIVRVNPLHAIAVAIEIGRALAALHMHGEPHGAVRMTQVELTEHGCVYLHGTGQRHHQQLRGPEEELELPENMAPEQIIGDAPDERTDVFLFGMLVYTLVADHAPFDRAEGNITHHIRHSAPPPLRRFIEDAPENLERIIRRCLEKRPRDRYADMLSVVSELLRVLRSYTSLPTEVLVSRMLSDAGLADERAGPLERGVDRGTASRQRWLRRFTRPIALGLFGLTALAVGWWTLHDSPRTGPTDPQGIVKRPAQLRVLAHPWAEVHIDGKLVDVTPIGRPIEMNPGPHTIVFKHPNAATQTRNIDFVAGQTILLDIDMQVVRPVDASAPTASQDETSP